MAWFLDQPEMLQGELDRLAALGTKFDIDEDAKARGILVIDVKYCIDDAELQLECSFPPEYPYFPPEIRCKEFPPGRHLEPFGKSLCIFADKNNSWDIAHDTLAGLIKDQVTRIYRIHKNPDEISSFENELEGYQPSGQLLAEENSIIVETSDCEPSASKGRGYIQLSPIKDGTREAIRGCLSQVFDEEGKLVFKDETGYSKRFSFRCPIRWVKLSKPLSAVDPEGIFSQLVAEFPCMNEPTYLKIGKVSVDIIGVCFKEEAARGQFEANWLFLIRRSWKRKGKPYGTISIIRSDHLHPNQLLARTPRLVGLAEATVAIIGLGALGSQVAFQLARAGVKNFYLVDRDHLQVGNLQRWIFGLPFVGMSKVQAVGQMLHQGYTGLSIQAFKLEIGGTPSITLEDGSKVLMTKFLNDEIIRKSDLVIDCTAMLNVNQYLSHLCKSHETDFVWCSATNGAWGGIVGRSPASYADDVWLKFNDEYGNRKIPEISTEPSAFVQPKGCFHPTFTGTGFDLDTISIMAARMAISILQGETYGILEHDVYVVEQWADKEPIAPRWKGFRY
ncbi:ThiF family adenylyltransferase [Alkalimonas collagenimarina]|uniref:ThiF family adenylyltransferase n=1 Tax=Alkalimonas collagenimarina TaxID=400390 RepID=A0ABT9GWZ2_9GAMM|nr:ThiF family adenylyltransferase [Alkalimonas collagenimarina]MDP4535579.1 ThiF family adenylyltransferase [Alkalimonas collagenimarina]